MGKAVGIFILCAGLAGGGIAFGEPSKAPEQLRLNEVDLECRSSLEEMKRILSRVKELRREARDSNDIVKLNCVNEKLSTIKGLLKVSEQAYKVFQEESLARNLLGLRHEADKILTARDKSAQLGADSEICIGEFAVYSGETELRTEVDPESAGESEFALGGDIDSAISDYDLPAVEPPPTASPYL